MIRGPKIVTCNRDYGCPCEFLAPPTRDEREGFEAMELSPIRNPVTGAPYRARIHLSDGRECRSAESASADASATAGVKFDDTHRYGFSTYVAYGPPGLIEGR
jgi:hypothetical protein